MKLKIFAIHDTKIAAYMQPFFMHTIGEAIRAFSDLVTDPKTSINKHPGDYHLFELGDYDDQKGAFTNVLAPNRISSALDFQNDPTRLLGNSVASTQRLGDLNAVKGGVQ